LITCLTQPIKQTGYEIFFFGYHTARKTLFPSLTSGEQCQCQCQWERVPVGTSASASASGESAGANASSGGGHPTTPACLPSAPSRSLNCSARSDAVKSFRALFTDTDTGTLPTGTLFLTPLPGCICPGRRRGKRSQCKTFRWRVNIGQNCADAPEKLIQMRRAL
jgi:hypothetical protein